MSDSVLSSSLLQLSSVTKHPASHPLTLFPSKLGESGCKAGVGVGGGRRGGVGGVDKATSVRDTNMAGSQHQYYVYAPSFSASHRVIDPPPCPASFPLPCPSLSSACSHSLKAAILAKKVVVWPDGVVFSPGSPLSGAVGRGLVGASEGFSERGGEGYSAGVARRLLRPVGFPVSRKLHLPVIKRTMKMCDTAACLQSVRKDLRCSCCF